MDSQYLAVVAMFVVVFVLFVPIDWTRVNFFGDGSEDDGSEDVVSKTDYNGSERSEMVEQSLV